MKEKNIVLIGGGGHCKSVIDILESLEYNILGILDTPEKKGEKILLIPIIGSDEDIQKYIDKAKFLITIGFITDPSIRIKLFNKVKEYNGQCATIVASTAYVSKYAEIGEGSIIMHNAVINAEAKIGQNCIINTFANIEHESIIGNNCHISTGVMINGGCMISDNVFIGSQSVVTQQVSIARDSIISAGSFIHKNILISGIYAGNPARKLR